MGPPGRSREGCRMMQWVKENVATVAAWIGMLATLLVSVVSHWTLAQVDREKTATALVELDDRVDEHDGLIRKLRSDVRSIAESQERAIAVIERTDEGLRALEQVTAELRAMTKKGNK